MKIKPGSLWRNKKSGAVSEVLRVEKNDVVLRVGKAGERTKYLAHFEHDYQPASEPYASKKIDPKDAEIAALRAELAEVDMIMNIVGADRDFRGKMLRATKARMGVVEAERDTALAKLKALGQA